MPRRRRLPTDFWMYIFTYEKCQQYCKICVLGKIRWAVSCIVDQTRIRLRYTSNWAVPGAQAWLVGFETLDHLLRSRIFGCLGSSHIERITSPSRYTSQQHKTEEVRINCTRIQISNCGVSLPNRPWTRYDKLYASSQPQNRCNIPSGLCDPTTSNGAKNRQAECQYSAIPFPISQSK